MIALSNAWVLLLAPLPLLMMRFAPVAEARGAVRAPASVIAFLQGQGALTGGASAEITGAALKALGWLALILALSGPFLPRPAVLTPTGRDVVVALDLSASMAERDMGAGGARTARIDVIRDRLAAFLRQRIGDRIALIGFATEAYLIAPLTFDATAVAEMLDEAPIGLPGRKTDLGQAIGLSVKLLRDEPDDGPRLLMLISDGEANAGDLAAADAARLARQMGLKILAIGVAADLSQHNIAHMAELAQATGGRFVAADSASAMDVATAALQDLAPIAPEPAAAERRRDLRWPLLLLALGCLCLLTWREARES